MAKASKKSPEEKLRVVLSVLRGELSAAAAGRRAGVSEQTVHNWKKAFLEGARDRLALGARRRRGGEPPQPPDAPAPRQVRCDRRRSRGTGRAQRRRHRPTQSRRRAGGSNQDAARRPPLGDQGPHPGDQPDPRPDRHRPRRVERPAPRAAHRPLIDACARLRPNPTGHQVTAAAKQARRTLARRHRALSAEINELDAELLALCADANPALLAAPGVGPDTAATLLVTAGDNPQRMATNASFAALCGASPIEASSGQHTRHRLNRGGDRQANNAPSGAHSTGQDPPRDHPLPQTPHRARNPPTAHRPAAAAPRRTPTPPSTQRRRHPRRRRTSPQHLHHPHLTTRTRHPPQPQPRHPLPKLAHPNRRFTHIGASRDTLIRLINAIHSTQRECRSRESQWDNEMKAETTWFHPQILSLVSLRDLQSTSCLSTSIRHAQVQ